MECLFLLCTSILSKKARSSDTIGSLSVRFISRLAKSLFVRKPSLSYGIRVLLIYLIKHAEEKSESVVYLLSRGRRPFDRLAVSLEQSYARGTRIGRPTLIPMVKFSRLRRPVRASERIFIYTNRGRILKAFIVPPSRLPLLRKAGLDL